MTVRPYPVYDVLPATDARQRASRAAFLDGTMTSTRQPGGGA
jgi:hypothetical protein